MIQWHRLLGLVMIDYFSNSPFRVELEKDLSQRQKFLDILLLRGDAADWHPQESPDGLEPEDLAPHTLVSFKSFRDSLNGEAMEHLISCVSDYRYQAQADQRAASGQPQARLLPDEAIRVMAVTARYPEDLVSSMGERWRESAQAGVYTMEWGTRTVVVIVCRRVERSARNALWLLFSGDPEKVDFAMRHFGLKQSDLSTILGEISDTYRLEGLNMPYTLEDFKREVRERRLEELKHPTPEEKEAVLSALSPGERLAGLSREERLAGLSRAERLAGLSRAEIEAFLKTLEDSSGQG